jgi:hypothetical protein
LHFAAVRITAHRVHLVFCGILLVFRGHPDVLGCSGRSRSLLRSALSDGPHFVPTSENSLRADYLGLRSCRSR